jgi:hypothetical protein
MDETFEEDVVEEIKEEVIEIPKKDNEIVEKPYIISEEINNNSPSLESVNSSVNVATSNNNVSDFSDFPDFPELTEDINENSNRITFNNVDSYNEPSYDSDNDSDNNIKLQIQDQPVNLDNLDIHVLDHPEMNLNDDFLLNEIEVLE